MPLRGLMFLAVALAAGCAGRPTGVAPAALAEFPSDWDCGGQRVTIRFLGERAELFVGDQAWTLRQVVAASGARYVAETDASTSVWNKGSRSRLVVAGREYPECVPIPAQERRR